MTNLCLICGEEVPEGRQICPNCESKVEYDPDEFFSAERQLDNPKTIAEAVRIIRTINPAYEHTRSGNAETMILQAIHDGASLIVRREPIYSTDKLEESGFEA